MRQEEDELRDVGGNEKHRYPAESHKGEGRFHYLVDRGAADASAEVKDGSRGRRDAS